jgi:hypothetical protein
MTAEKRNDEIDLIEVFFNTYIFFKRKFWYLFIATIIGAGLGYSTKFYAKPHFESSMIIESYTISNELLSEYIEKFQELLKDKNYNFLQKETGLTIEELRSIREITTDIPFDDKKKEELGYVIVKVKCIHNTVLNKLSQGILNFVGNETYVIDEIDNFKIKNTAIIDHITKEIKNLQPDNSKSSRNFKEENKINVFNNDEFFYNELIFLLEQKFDREKELQFAVPFRVIEDFTVYLRPVKKSTTYSVAGGLLLWFLTLIVILIRRINKKIKRY